MGSEDVLKWVNDADDEKNRATVLPAPTSSSKAPVSGNNDSRAIASHDQGVN